MSKNANAVHSTSFSNLVSGLDPSIATTGSTGGEEGKSLSWVSSLGEDDSAKGSEACESAGGDLGERDVEASEIGRANLSCGYAVSTI